MPNRIIREGILTSERVNKLDWPEEVFYRRLMSVVDDFGLFDGRPSVIRAAIYQLKLDQVREADVSRWIAACVKAGLVRLYSAQGKDYLQLLDVRWQVRSKSKWPLPLEKCEDGGDRAQVQSIDINCAQLRTKAHAHSDAQAQAQAQPGGLAGGGVEDRIKAWFADHKHVIYSRVAETAMLRMVNAHGWQSAVEGVNEAIAKGASKPFAYAETMLNGRQAKNELKRSAGRAETLQKARVYSS